MIDYSKMSDADLLAAAGNSSAPDYSTMSDADLLALANPTPQQPVVPSPPPSGIIRRAADVPLGLLKGAIGLPEAAVGLADMVTGGYAGKGAEYLGFRPKEAKEIINTWQSPELNQARENVQSAKGFVPTLGAMVQNPSTIVDAAAESAPSMIGGAGIARGAMKLAPKISGALAAGIGEGVVTAGSSAEQVRQETPDGLLTAKQMIAPAVSGALTGGLGVMGGKIAQKLGIADIDTMLATGAIKQSDHGLLRRVAEGAFSEGILEELPQSAQEQALQNIALNKPWNEGVAEAAASGMLVGGIMGGGGNVLSSTPAKNDIETDLAARTPEAAQEAAPIAPVKTGNPLSDALATVAPSPITARPDAEMEAVLSEPQVDTPAPVDVPEKGAPVQGLPAEEDIFSAESMAASANKTPVAQSVDEILNIQPPETDSNGEVIDESPLNAWIKTLPKAKQFRLVKRMGEPGGMATVLKRFADANPEYAQEATNVEDVQAAVPEVAQVGQDVPLSRELPVVSEEPAVSPPESAGGGGEQEVGTQLYRGVTNIENPSQKGVFSKGVESGNFWSKDKEVAEIYKGESGAILEANLPPTAKVLDLETPEGQAVYERLTNSKFDPYRVIERGIDESAGDITLAEALKAEGYDAVHSFDMDGPETLILNKEILKITPADMPAAPEPVVDPTTGAQDMSETVAGAESVKTTPAEVVTEAVKVAKQEGTPLKEQKKFLLENIDEAMADAPSNKADILRIAELNNLTKNNGEKDGEWNVRKLAAKEQIAALHEKIGKVTIHVPDDGTFQVLNTKESLATFKANVSKMFPSGPESKGREGYGPLPKQSNIKAEGLEGSAIGKDAQGNEWHTNGQIIVKGKASVPAKSPMESAKAEVITRQTPRLVADYGTTKGTDLVDKIQFVTMSGDMEKNGHFVSSSDGPMKTGKDESGFVRLTSEQGKTAEISQKYYIYAKQHFPNAEIRMTDGKNPVKFVDKGEVVVVVMPLNLGASVKDRINTALESDPKLSRAAAPIANAHTASSLQAAFDKIVNWAGLKRTGMFHVVASGDMLPDSVKSAFSRLSAAWHGGPHDFNTFDMDKVGTGEGAQAYGYGLYFAGNREVAEYYQKTLAQSRATKNDFVAEFVKLLPDAPADVPKNIYAWMLTETADRAVTIAYNQNADIRETIRKIGKDEIAKVADAAYKKQKGRLYAVELAPAEDEYLLWDKPLSEQSEKVKAALESAPDLPKIRAFLGGMRGTSFVDATNMPYFSGRDFYQEMEVSLGSDKIASEYLHSLGIRGIKYADGNTRNKAEQNFNYVIFNDQDVSITEKYSLVADKSGIKGVVTPDGQVYFVADQIGKGQEKGLLLHEIGVHFGLENMVGADKFAAILKQMESMRDTSESVKRAYASVPKDTSAKLVNEEALGYLAEQNPKHGIIRRLIAAIKSFLFQKGILQAKHLKEADLMAVLNASLEKVSKGAVGGRQFDSAKKSTGEKRLTLYRGDSTSADGVGKGSIGDLGQGIYFTSDSIYAEYFTDGSDKTHTRSFKVDIQNPFDMTDRNLKDNPSTKRILADMPEGLQKVQFTRWLNNDLDVKNNYGFIARVTGNEVETFNDFLQKYGFDAVIDQGIRGVSDGGKQYVIFDKSQIDTNADIRYSRVSDIVDAIPTSRADFTDTIKSAIQNTPLFDRLATNIFDNGMVVSRWGRSVGTMYHIASKKDNEEFKRVFDLGQQFITDINSFAAKAEALAPNIFPKFGIGAGMLKSVSKADNALISKALFEGTLANGASPTSGVIWSDKELQEKYGMNKEQRTMYNEARAAVNRSLDDMAKSTIFTTALRAKVGNDFRRYKEDSVDAVAKKINAEIQGKIDELYKVIDAKGFDAFNNKKDSDVAKFDKLKDFQKSINKVASTTDSLKAHGYFPLSRFGDHTVTVKDAEGKTVYYGMYEGPHDAVKAMRSLAKDFPNHNIKRGTVDKEAYKIYGGLTLEAVELFAEHMEAEDTKPYQEYLKNAVNNRSAMKHMIQRKGTAGYSSDGVRTLANFIYSNARFASKNLNMKLMGQAVNQMEKNDLSAMASKLQEYLNNPVEEFSKLRGFMFIHYLGGSIASGITNMTQVVLMLAPYLAQNTSAANVVKQVTAASKDAFTSPNKLKKPDERKLMMELDEEGETAPQEIHQLAAIASNRLGASNPLWNAGLKAWGSIFSVTEIFNRRTTALATFRIAIENGKSYEEAKAEAIKAIKETQGLYNKGNRPMWGRGVLGAPLFTFKQFSVMYLELLQRMPAKQKLMMLGLLMMASGAEGLPFAGDLEDLIDTIGQWLGYGTNSKRWIKEKVGGTPVGDFFLKGVSSVAPIDVQGRLGMNNLIPGTAILKQSSTDKGRDVKEFFGPMGGLFTAASDSLELLAKGQVARAVKAASPRAIQGIATGAEMALTGKATDKYGRKTFDATPVEAAEKFVGFNPSRMAEESQVKMGLMQDKQLLTVRTEEIVNDMAQAKIDRDAKAQREAMDKWRKWNADNPDLKIPAIHTKVANRIKVLRSTSADRFKKSMPKDQRAAIARELS